MDAATFYRLKRISERHPREFGKICQILLAICFCRLGFRRVVERSVQGVDIDISDHLTFPNFSIEVKTTLNNTVQIGQKDIKGLEIKAKDGYETAFAVLRLGLLSDWIIAKAKGILAGEILIGRFETRVIRGLQNEVNGEFPHVVGDYANEILRKRTTQVQAYLQKCLANEKQKAVRKGERTECGAGSMLRPP